MNPDQLCNFRCVYCEVDRRLAKPEALLDVDVMALELKSTLTALLNGHLREIPFYRRLPDEVLQLRQVELSGDGEPTLAPRFAEALRAIVHVRASSGFPFFKLVLVTNASNLDLPHVGQAINRLTQGDEVWAKLDAGSQAYFNRVNRADVPLEKVLSNILDLSRQRPVVIQSLFPAINSEEPSLEDIEQYVQRLLDLKNGGAQILLVQIYSAAPSRANPETKHVSLKVLTRIAQTVHQVTGLKTEVF